MKKVQMGFLAMILSVSALALAAGWFQRSDGSASNASARVATSAQTTEGTRLKWDSDLEAALERSKVSGKPVFVDFYATWCPPCNLMDSTTFQDEKVKAELQHYELVKVDVDKAGDVAAQYGIQALPTLVCLKPEGTRTDMLGYQAPQKLVQRLKGCTGAGNAAAQDG